MQQLVTKNGPVKTGSQMNSSKILVLYYGATVVFLALDLALGVNLRIAFLDSLPLARAAYYGVCFACLALMLWRPAWTVLISAFESLVTLSALIISMGMRTLLVSDRVVETGSGYVTMPEIYNFLISGSVAYVAWVRGMSRMKNLKSGEKL